ncbi:LOW QUALITY PROTEIN: uncharacterized protein [Diadema setosum]|uniref:LOW QUALITY PROTEIN: uncharacterized protein n=1 Tax=Diadema setosum TaxID=31175 RepID=UPI003B3B55DF
MSIDYRESSQADVTTTVHEDESEEVSELNLSVEYTEREGYVFPREEILQDEDDGNWHPPYRQNKDILKTLDVTDDLEDVFGSGEALQDTTQEEEMSVTVRGLHHKTKTAQDAATTKLFIVTEAMVTELAMKGKCPQCHGDVDVQIAPAGTSAHLTIECASGHISRFCMQETVNGSHVGDIKFASAILLSGNNFLKIKRMADVMNLHMFSSKLFSAVQNHYVCPVVEGMATTIFEETREKLKDKEIVLCGDARNDSPGFCSQYCTYTVMDHDSKEVVDVEFLDKRQAHDKSTTMEPMALIKALDKIKALGLSVKELVTDAHPTISAILRKDYREIIHSWDVWHGAKNVGKKVSKASNLAAQRSLKYWTKHIVNHFWFCAKTCEGNPDVFLSKWRGLVHHVTNKHDWTITGGLGGVPHCEHRELENPEREEWLQSGTKAHDALVKIVLDKRFLKTLAHFVNFRHTGELEALHNHILMYCGKRFAFGYRAYRARNILAIIDYSKHKDRAIAVDEHGNPKLKAKWSKHAGDWVVHEVRVGKTYSYDVEMMTEIMNLRLHDTRPLFRSPDPIPDDPAVIRPRLAPVPPPSKEELRERRKSRFSTEEGMKSIKIVLQLAFDRPQQTASRSFGMGRQLVQVHHPGAGHAIVSFGGQFNMSISIPLCLSTTVRRRSLSL